MTPEPAAAKSSTYFALLETFSKGGCPICHLTQASATAYLEALFYEQVTDVGTRRKLRQTRGFCNGHLWEARTSKIAPLGVAIIAEDLLDEELIRLSALRPRLLARLVTPPERDKINPRTLLAFLRAWRQRGMCPACRVAVEHETHALATLLTSLPEADFAQRFEASGGLCLPHMMRTVEQHASHPALNALIESQRRKYARMIAELAAFRRKHDDRLTGSPWGTEADSWLRAIEMLAGKPGVYGTDLHRRPSGGGLQHWWQRLMASIARARGGG
jgi:hypothetical protein